MVDDGLTTAESWDQLWVPKGRPSRRFRSRLRSHASWVTLLERLLDVTESGSDVLELGCAPGAMIEQMHELRPAHHYYGLDIAEGGLRVARMRLAAGGIDAKLSLGDIRDAEHPPADLVVSFGLAEHFSSPAAAPQYHARFAKPGGFVGVTVPNYSHPVVVSLMRRFTPETLATHNLEIMRPAALARAMTEAGLRVVAVGESGGPTLPNSRPRPGKIGKLYRTAARGWNLSSTVLPEGKPWSTSVWAIGQAAS